MKKVLLLLTLISIGLFVNAQVLDNEIHLKDLDRIGISTELKDTLYLIDTPISYGIKDTWDGITEEQLKADGIEKPPVFIMVPTIEEFIILVDRILYCDENEGLEISNIYQ